MITKETAEKIWSAYREIEAGEKLLADMAQETSCGERDPYAPTLRDAFGRLRLLQLGIPSGESGHRLFGVSPVLAEAVIRAHVSNKRSELVVLNEHARSELDASLHPVSRSTAPEQPEVPEVTS